MSNKSELTFNTRGATWIADSLYVESPEALDSVLNEIRTVGYNVENLRECDSRAKDGTTVDQMEKDGWSLWYCSLKDIRYGKCGSCNEYISIRGILSHGHQCEKCGVVTYLDMIEGSRVRFHFAGDEAWFRHLEMKVYFWDADHGDLYLYPDPIETGSSITLSGERAQAYLQEFKDKWEEVVYEGKILYKVKYLNSSYVEDISTINVSETMKHHWNHKIVTLWNRKEYSEWESLPVPECFSIYETWHWAPLQPSPTLHEKIIHAGGMVADQGYYYQDGRTAFYQAHWDRMRTFVDKFTTLSVREWDRQHFRIDGPGAIADIAKFCHNSPQVTNIPNFGNTLVALGKAISGEDISQRELDAAIDGSHSPHNPFL